MGSTSSKLSTPEQQEARRQQQLLETLGVLLPPSFGITNDPPSAITMRRPSPSLIYSLETNSTCYRILHQHLNSGLWVSASTASQASVLAAFYVEGDTNQGMLSASQSFPENKGKASIRAYTSEPSLAYGVYSPTPYLNLVANAEATGMGWLGANVSIDNPTKWFDDKKVPQQNEYYRNNPFVDENKDTDTSNTTVENLQFGASVKLQQASTTNRPSSSKVFAESVLGYASLDVAGCKVAMEAKVPLESYYDPQVSYYACANLNTDEGPPLILTMQQSPSHTSMNLSQVLTFDRIVVNALETRCPRIRNTLGWAVEMKKTQDSQATLSAGVAWQINRGLGIKVVANSEKGITGAILLKRWKQPRVLCSLLAGTKGNPGQDIQLGIGLELETGPHQQDYYNEMEEQRVDDSVPATKATLPEIGVTVINK